MECSDVSLENASKPDPAQSPPLIAENEDEDVEFMEVDGFSEEEEASDIIEDFVPEFDSTRISDDVSANVAPELDSAPVAEPSSAKDSEANEDVVTKDTIVPSKTDGPSKRKEIAAPRRSRSRSKSRRSRSRGKRRSRSRSRKHSHSRSMRRSGRRRSRSRSRKRSGSRSKTSSRRSRSRSRKRSHSRDRSRKKSPVADKSIITSDASNVIIDDAPKDDDTCVVLNEVSAVAVEPSALESTDTEKLQKDLDDLKTSLKKPRSRSKSRERKRSKSEDMKRSQSRDRKQSSKSSTRKRSRFSDRKSKSRSKSPESESKRQRKSLSLLEKLSEANARVPAKHQRSPLSQRKRHIGDKDCPPPSQCIIVFGLPLSYRETELEEMWFPKYEGVDSSVIVDRLSGISRGFGFVNFSTVEQAESAMKTVAGMMVDGSEITCKFSITKKRHTPTPNHYLGDDKTLQYLSKPRKFDGQKFH